MNGAKATVGVAARRNDRAEWFGVDRAALPIRPLIERTKALQNKVKGIETQACSPHDGDDLKPVVPPPAPRPRRKRLSVSRSLLCVAPLMAADVVALLLATLIAFVVLRAVGPLPIRGIHRIMPPLAVIISLGFFSSGLYGVVGINPVVELRQLTRFCTLILLTTLMASYVVGAQPYWRVFFGVEYVASIVLLPVMRSLVRPWCARRSWWGQPALIFGPPDEAAALSRVLQQHPTGGLRPLAIVTDTEGPFTRARRGMPILSMARAARVVATGRVSYAVVIAPDHNPRARAAALAAASELSLPHVLVMSPHGDLPTLWCDARECAGLHAVEVRNRLLLPFPRFVKRASDLLLTIVGGLMISPLLLAIAVLVKLTSPGPIFYGHTRIGLGGRRFKAWKFRTMRKDADEVLQHYLSAHPELQDEWARDHKLKKDPRVTWAGRFLRKSSLDELPQLWNVFTGEMSLVGPRPVVEDEVDLYGTALDMIVRAKPGITGLWQVSGRNSTSFSQRIDLQNYYVRNWSPWLDLHVLIRTASAVAIQKGAS